LRRAARIDENQVDIVAALRKVGCRVKSTAAVGDGWADLTVLGPDKKTLFLMEIKDGTKPPSRRRLTPAQIKTHEEWPIHVVTNWAEALNVVAWRRDEQQA